MAEGKLTIMYWRDIPAQVIAKAGRANARRELSPRFQEAIDAAAMEFGAHGTDDYLEGWRKGTPELCGSNLEAAVDAAAAPLMAGEDFSYMLEKCPGAYVFIGNGDSASLHSASYDFADDALVFGASYWQRLAEAALARS